MSPDRFQRYVLVCDRAGEICFRVSAIEAAGMCAEEKARRLSRDRIKLTGKMEFHPCRTRTGRSYTYQEPTQVAVDQLAVTKTGEYLGPIPIQPSGRSVLMHKSIATEDRGYFLMAISDNLQIK